MTIRCIDIETTGIDPTHDRIVEIASVDVLADHTIANRRETLLSPGVPMPALASAVHHLIDEDLEGAPARPVARSIVASISEYRMATVA
jgi:DNA polymerase III epsilon subunit-like protein